MFHRDTQHFAAFRLLELKNCKMQKDGKNARSTINVALVELKKLLEEMHT